MPSVNPGKIGNSHSLKFKTKRVSLGSVYKGSGDVDPRDHSGGIETATSWGGGIASWTRRWWRPRLGRVHSGCSWEKGLDTIPSWSRTLCTHTPGSSSAICSDARREMIQFKKKMLKHKHSFFLLSVMIWVMNSEVDGTIFIWVKVRGSPFHKCNALNHFAALGMYKIPWSFSTKGLAYFVHTSFLCWLLLLAVASFQTKIMQESNNTVRFFFK